MSFTQLDLWNDHIDDVWLSFKDARALVHTWNLEYRVDWSDWFGLHIAFTNYNETKKFIHTLHLRSPEEWDVWCQGNLFGRPKKPKVIYRYPELAYRGRGWTNWKDWLG